MIFSCGQFAPHHSRHNDNSVFIDFNIERITCARRFVYGQYDSSTRACSRKRTGNVVNGHNGIAIDLIIEILRLSQRTALRIIHGRCCRLTGIYDQLVKGDGVIRLLVVLGKVEAPTPALRTT